MTRTDQATPTGINNVGDWQFESIGHVSDDGEDDEAGEDRSGAVADRHDQRVSEKNIEYLFLLTPTAKAAKECKLHFE